MFDLENNKITNNEMIDLFQDFNVTNNINKIEEIKEEDILSIFNDDSSIKIDKIDNSQKEITINSENIKIIISQLLKELENKTIEITLKIK